MLKYGEIKQITWAKETQEYAAKLYQVSSLFCLNSHGSSFVQVLFRWFIYLQRCFMKKSVQQRTILGFIFKQSQKCFNVIKNSIWKYENF